KSFKHDAIKRFYKSWYRPNLMAVIVVGDIKKADAEAMIKKHFGSLTNDANAPERKTAAVPPYTENDATVVTDKEATSYDAVIEYPAYTLNAPVTYDE